MRWISSELPCSRPPQCAVRNPVFESNRGPDEYHWWREGLNASDDGNSNWRNLLTHAYNLYYSSWTAGQRNDFQVATLAAYWASDTDRHDEASLDRAVGKAVDDAVTRLMSSSKSSTPTPPPSAPAVLGGGQGIMGMGNWVLSSDGDEDLGRTIDLPVHIVRPTISLSWGSGGWGNWWDWHHDEDEYYYDPSDECHDMGGEYDPYTGECYSGNTGQVQEERDSEECRSLSAQMRSLSNDIALSLDRISNLSEYGQRLASAMVVDGLISPGTATAYAVFNNGVNLALASLSDWSLGFSKGMFIDTPVTFAIGVSALSQGDSSGWWNVANAGGTAMLSLLILEYNPTSSNPNKVRLVARGSGVLLAGSIAITTFEAFGPSIANIRQQKRILDDLNQRIDTLFDSTRPRQTELERLHKEWKDKGCGDN